MNSNGRNNNPGRKSWGVNLTSKGLLNAGFGYPGLGLTALCIQKVPVVWGEIPAFAFYLF